MEIKDRYDHMFCECGQEIQSGTVCADCEAEQENCPTCKSKHSLVKDVHCYICQICGDVINENELI